MSKGEQVRICLQKIQNAENRYNAEVRIATNTKMDEQRPYLTEIAALKQKYEHKIYELAEEQDRFHVAVGESLGSIVGVM